MRDLPQNIRAMKEDCPHRCWATSKLSETRHCNVLCATYRKTLEQRQKVVHTGVGYPAPPWLRLNTVMCYARLTKKHQSNYRRSSMVWAMCNVHAKECFGASFKGRPVVNVSAGSLTITSGGQVRGCAWLVGIVVYYTLLYIIGGKWGLSLIVVLMDPPLAM